MACSAFIPSLAVYGERKIFGRRDINCAWYAVLMLVYSLSCCSFGPLVENIAVFPLAKAITRLQVTVTIPEEANISYGDQAGVLVYWSDFQWIKLVLEGARAPRGARMIVLARMPSNADDVALGVAPEANSLENYQKFPLLGPVRLGLELRRTSARCTLIASYRIDDQTSSTTHTHEFDLGAGFSCDAARLGVMAHLEVEKAPCPPEHWFRFSEFSVGP
jgi:hypothetical protein